MRWIRRSDKLHLSYRKLILSCPYDFTATRGVVREEVVTTGEVKRGATSETPQPAAARSAPANSGVLARRVPTRSCRPGFLRLPLHTPPHRRCTPLHNDQDAAPRCD